jgi:hypothetical protein
VREHSFFRLFLLFLLACLLASLWLLGVLSAGGLPRAGGAPAPPGRAAGPAPEVSPVGNWRWGDFAVRMEAGGAYTACRLVGGRDWWAGRWRLRAGRLRVVECHVDPDSHTLDPAALTWDTAWPSPDVRPAPGPPPPLPLAEAARVQ